MKKYTSRFFILLLLGLLFLSPGLAALLYYQHPGWLSGKTTNKGLLLQPAVKIASIGEKKKWRLVYLTGTSCGAHCFNQLDKLYRIRLALGRRFYEVEQWLVLDGQENLLPIELQQALQEKTIAWKRMVLAARPHAIKNNKIYLISPENYAVLTYKNTASSKDIYQDLKHLLTTTSQQSM